MKRHWSFIVTDKRYLYPIAGVILVAGLAAAFVWRDPLLFARAGNFIIGTGVWMGMRSTLREGINKHKDASDSSPLMQNQLNTNYFNRISFSIGDAQLQLHGFALVILGSIVGSFGDLLLRAMWPQYFPH